MSNFIYDSIYYSLSANPTLQSIYSSLISASNRNVFKAQTAFPAITSTNPLDWKKYLCYITGLAGMEDVDPVMAGQPDFAIDAQRPDFELLMGVGDPRYSLGTLLSSVYARYETRSELLIDIQRNGGCQVVENYICTEDGTPVKKVSENCIGVSTAPITPQEVIGFVTVSYNQAILDDADGFVKFLQREYINKGWTVALHTYADVPLFFARAYKPDNKVFYRYYYEQKDYVATSLNLEITRVTQELISESFLGVNEAILKAIPSYTVYNT